MDVIEWAQENSKHVKIMDTLTPEGMLVDVAINRNVGDDTMIKNPQLLSHARRGFTVILFSGSENTI